MRKLLSVAVGLWLSLLPINVLAEYAIYILGESFTWESKDTAEKDQGYIYGTGTTAKWNPYAHLIFKVRAEIFGNRFTHTRPAGESVTDYLWIKVECDVGWTFPVGKSLSLKPLAGFGYKRWVRDVETSATFSADTSINRSHYWRLGIWSDYFISKDLKIFAEAVVMLPFTSRVKRTRDSLRVDPGNRASVFGELGVKYKSVMITVYYDGLRFPRTEGLFVVPEINVDRSGIKIGFVFR